MLDNLQKLLTRGFNTLYHGTRQSDAIKREGFRPSKDGNLGPGVYATGDRNLAQGYAEGFRGLRRGLLRLPPRVLKGRVPPGAKIADLANLPRDLRDLLKLPDFSDFTKGAQARGYHGLGYKTRSMNEMTFFDPKVANAAFGVGKPRFMPKMSMEGKFLVFEKFTLPLLKALAQSAGKPGQAPFNSNLFGRDAPTYNTPFNK